MGQPSIGIDVLIINPEGQELPRDEVGAIIVLIRGVVLGYWNRPEETTKALAWPGREGWMYTGDVGRMDAEGFVFLVDRVKDMIVSGGETVYSVEVEPAFAPPPPRLPTAR